MNSNRFTKSCGYALRAVLALSAPATFATDADRAASAADTPVTPVMAAPAAVTYAQADATVLTSVARPATEPETIRPMEVRVRKAAAEGPTALRRYILRTEPIYHFSYWDYAKYLPRE